jgi:Fur family ferric uptake transcriptional regulator
VTDDDPRLRRFADFLARSGLKATRQRALIVRAFFGAGQHLSAEELYHQIYAQAPGIGLVTVYRTLKLLRDAGLATERRFGESYARFDPSPADRPHNHLICTRCGKIQEFRNRGLPHLQQKVARGYGFAVNECKLELYGLCRDCARSSRACGHRTVRRPARTHSRSRPERARRGAVS